MFMQLVAQASHSAKQAKQAAIQFLESFILSNFDVLFYSVPLFTRSSVSLLPQFIYNNSTFFPLNPFHILGTYRVYRT